MFSMTRKSAYFDDCTSVVKCYLSYLISGEVVEDLCKMNEEMDEGVAGLYVTIQNDYKVCSEVLRHAVSVALGLESGLNYFHWKDLALVCATHLEGHLEFAQSLSRSKKQGVLQTCIHIFFILKDIAVSEV